MPLPWAWTFLTPEVWLAGFKKGEYLTLLKSIKVMGLMVSEKKIYYVLPFLSLWELMTPGV